MTHIIQRRDLSATWALSNPVLQLGEVGWETDTRKAKLGDGVTTWNSLDYAVDTMSGGGAPIDSPAFTGNPTAPTPTLSDSDTSIATTAFVKGQNYAPISSPVLTGDPKAPTPATADNDTSIATTAFVKNAIAAALTAERLVLNPVNSLYFTATNINPGTFLGGTWAAFGTGRVLVGVDTGQTEFDTAGETGGEKAHVLTTAEIPNHNHTQNTANSAPGSGPYAWPSGNLAAYSTAGSSGIVTTSVGGGGAHNNLQPYITGYMWKRTA